MNNGIGEWSLLDFLLIIAKRGSSKHHTEETETLILHTPYYLTASIYPIPL